MADEQGEQSQVKKEGKTIYDVGYGSVFLKNFLAGFSRALGAIFVYLILGSLIYYFVVTTVMPQIRSVLPQFFLPFGPTATQTSPGSSGLSPEEIEAAIESLRQPPR